MPVILVTALDLPPTEFRLLRHLACSPDRAVDSHIRNLRRTLETALPGSDAIRSVCGVG